MNLIHYETPTIYRVMLEICGGMCLCVCAHVCKCIYVNNIHIHKYLYIYFKVENATSFKMSLKVVLARINVIATRMKILTEIFLMLFILVGIDYPLEFYSLYVLNKVYSPGLQRAYALWS